MNILASHPIMACITCYALGVLTATVLSMHTVSLFQGALGRITRASKFNG